MKFPSPTPDVMKENLLGEGVNSSDLFLTSPLRDSGAINLDNHCFNQ